MQVKKEEFQNSEEDKKRRSEYAPKYKGSLKSIQEQIKAQIKKRNKVQE